MSCAASKSMLDIAHLFKRKKNDQSSIFQAVASLMEVAEAFTYVLTQHVAKPRQDHVHPPLHAIDTVLL